MKTHVYVATDGIYSKIGITNDPDGRKPAPIRLLEGDSRKAAVRIVKAWHRPNDASDIESRFRGYFTHRCVAGFEWFAVEPEILVKFVEREIWFSDEQPKDKLSRCPIPLREVWVFDRDLPEIDPGIVRLATSGGRVGRAPSLDAKGKAKALKLLNAGELSRAAIARECGVSPTTIHNYFEWSPRKKIWRERTK